MNETSCEDTASVPKCSISVIEHVLNEASWLALLNFQNIFVLSLKLTHAWIMRPDLHISAHCVLKNLSVYRSSYLTPQMTQNLLKSGQKSLSFLLLSMTYFKWFLPTVYSAELWDMTDCFTSYARIRIKTRVPPEWGRSSWQLGQVLQIGRGPRWGRGKGIISSSCLGSWFSITVSMMIHVGVASFIASTFFLQSWSSPFFIVYKIGHSSS